MLQSSKKGLQHHRITPKLLVLAVTILSLSSGPLALAAGLFFPLQS